MYTKLKSQFFRIVLRGDGSKGYRHARFSRYHCVCLSWKIFLIDQTATILNLQICREHLEDKM